MTPFKRASIDATILLRSRVSNGQAPTVADCWLLNAALRVEGRSPEYRIGDKEVE